MTAALSPSRALEELLELSPEIREGVLLDGEGRRLAGSRVLAGAAKDLLAATRAPELEVGGPRGAVFAVRGDGVSAVVVCDRSALPALMLCDLRAVLARTAEDA